MKRKTVKISLTPKEQDYIADAFDVLIKDYEEGDNQKTAEKYEKTFHKLLKKFEQAKCSKSPPQKFP